MMRIISGSRRGKKLLTLFGDNTRPTLERVKQAFFSAIQFDIPQRKVLDLFAGSGQLGLEALSRGASFCYFNDMSKEASAIVQKNINLCNFSEMSYLTCKSYIDCVRIINNRKDKVSLVFLDPPYSNDLVNSALNVMRDNDILEDDAIIVCESAADDNICADGFELYREYKYSEIKVTILKVKVK
jgi:16S rRNA (guanine(966)-N(2))-methyltransferase RsmD